MAQTNVSIRLDEDVKKDVEALFSKLGLTLSSATNIFYRQALRTQSIPFPLSAAPITPKQQARKTFGEAFKAAQQQSELNGTQDITMDEIDAIIEECRKETSHTQ